MGRGHPSILRRDFQLRKPVILCKAFYSLLTYCVYLTQEREVPGNKNSELDKVDLFFHKEVLRKHPKVSCTINRSKAG